MPSDPLVVQGPARTTVRFKPGCSCNTKYRTTRANLPLTLEVPNLTLSPPPPPWYQI